MLQHPTGEDVSEDIQRLSYGGGPRILLAAATRSLLLTFSLETIIEGVFQADRVAMVGSEAAPSLLPMHTTVMHFTPLTDSLVSDERHSNAMPALHMEWTQQLDGILLCLDSSLQMWHIATGNSTLHLAWTANIVQTSHDLISPGVSATSPSASASSRSHESSAVSVWWPSFSQEQSTSSSSTPSSPLPPKEEKLKHPCPIAALEWCPGVLAKGRLDEWNGAKDGRQDAPQDHPALMTLTVDGTVRLWVEMLVVHQPSPSAPSSLDSYFAMALLIPGQENIGISPTVKPTARWARRVGPLLNRTPHASAATVVPPTKVLWLAVTNQNQISIFALRGLSPVVITNFPGAQVPGASSISTETKRPQYLLWGTYSWDCLPGMFSAWVHAGEDFPHVTFFDHVGMELYRDATIHVRGITFATALKECSSSPLAMQQRLDVLESWERAVPLHASGIACMHFHPTLPLIATMDASGRVILWTVGGDIQSKRFYGQKKELSAVLCFVVDGIDMTNSFCRIFLMSGSQDELLILTCDANNLFLYAVNMEEALSPQGDRKVSAHHCWTKPLARRIGTEGQEQEQGLGNSQHVVSIHLLSGGQDGGEEGEKIREDARGREYPIVLIVYDDGDKVLFSGATGNKQGSRMLIDDAVTSCCIIPSHCTVLMGTSTGEIHAAGYLDSDADKSNRSDMKRSALHLPLAAPILAIAVDEFQELGAVLCSRSREKREVFIFNLNRVLCAGDGMENLGGSFWSLRLENPETESRSSECPEPVSLCWIRDMAVPILALGRDDGSVALYAPLRVDELLHSTFSCPEGDACHSHQNNTILKWTPLTVSRAYGAPVAHSQSLICGIDGSLYMAAGARLVELSPRSITETSWFNHRAAPLPQRSPAFVRAALASGYISMTLDILTFWLSSSAAPSLLPLSSFLPRFDEQDNAIAIDIDSILVMLGIGIGNDQNQSQSQSTESKVGGPVKSSSTLIGTLGTSPLVAVDDVNSGLLDLGAWGIMPSETLPESDSRGFDSLGSLQNEKKKERTIPFVPAPSSYSDLPTSLSCLVRSLSPYSGLVLDDAGVFAACLIAIAQADVEPSMVHKGEVQKSRGCSTLGLLPGLHPAVIFWSLATNFPQVALLGRNEQNIFSSWDGLKARGAGFWLRETSEMIKIAESLAKKDFAATRQPDDAALWYAALGKKGVLGGLYRTTGATKQAEFLLRDFDQPRHQEAASKNAFVLLGQHRYKLAAAFFVLGRRFKDAASVCAVEMGDVQLAVFLARLMDETMLSSRGESFRKGNCAGPTESYIIEKFVTIQQNRWIKAAGFWVLGDFHRVMHALTSDKESDVNGTSAYSLLNYLDAVQLLPAMATASCHFVNGTCSNSEDLAPDYGKTMSHDIAAVSYRCIKSLDAAGLHIFGLRYWVLLHRLLENIRVVEEASLLRSVTASLLVCCHSNSSSEMSGIKDVHIDTLFGYMYDALEQCGLMMDAGNSTVLAQRLAGMEKMVGGANRSAASPFASPDAKFVSTANKLAHSDVASSPCDDGRLYSGDAKSQKERECHVDGLLGKGSIVVKVDADRLTGVVACPLISPDLLGRPVVVASHKHGLLECAVNLETSSSSPPTPYAGARARTCEDDKKNTSNEKNEKGKETHQQGGGLFSRLLMQIFDQASWDGTFPSTLLDGDVVGAAVASAAYEETMLPHNVRSLALAAHPSRPLLLSGCETTGRVLLWQFGGPKLLATFTPMASKDLKSASQFDAGGLLFFSSQLSRSFSKSLVSRMSNWGGVRGLAFAPGGGDRFAAIGEGGVVATWRLAHASSSALDVDGAVCAEWWHHCLGKEGRAVTYVGGSNHVLAVGGRGGGENKNDLSIWDTSAPPNNAACIASRSLKSTVTALTTLPGGWLLSYGDAKGWLYLSDIRMLGAEERGNEVLWSVKASSGGVSALCGLPANNIQAALEDVAAGATRGAGAYVVSGSQDGVVRVWSAASGALVQSLGTDSGTGMDTRVINTTPPLSPLSPTSPTSPHRHAHAMFSGISGIWGQGTCPAVTGLATCEEGLIASYSNGFVRLFPVGDDGARSER